MTDKHNIHKGIYSGYPFYGIPTFLRSKHIEDSEIDNTAFDIGVVGVPFDEGSPYLPGSRFGPRAIREQSLRFSKQGIFNVDKRKVFLNKELQENRIADLGDVNIIPTDISGNIKKITNKVKKVINKNALPITIGGDHSIAHPVIKSFEELNEPIHVVQIDAHPDFSEICDGFEHTNAHPFTYVSNMKHVKSLTQIGIRSSRAFSVIDSEKAGNRVVGMKEFRDIGPRGISQLIPENEACYVSIDIDALDCSLIPGCVSAEPNGLTFSELTESLETLAKHNKIVGFDLVEVAPILDVQTNITSLLAAQIITEFLGNICDQDYWKERYK